VEHSSPSGRIFSPRSSLLRRLHLAIHPATCGRPLYLAHRCIDSTERRSEQSLHARLRFVDRPLPRFMQAVDLDEHQRYCWVARRGWDE